MRKKQQITQLETQVSELMAVVNSLLDVVTKPTVTKPAPKQETLFAPIKDDNRKIVIADKSRTRWEQTEIEAIVKMHNNGLAYEEIARLMHRSTRAIENQISRVRTGKVS